MLLPRSIKSAPDVLWTSGVLRGPPLPYDSNTNSIHSNILYICVYMYNIYIYIYIERERDVLLLVYMISKHDKMRLRRTPCKVVTKGATSHEVVMGREGRQI